jgi:hypothetical protein
MPGKKNRSSAAAAEVLASSSVDAAGVAIFPRTQHDENAHKNLGKKFPRIMCQKR